MSSVGRLLWVVVLLGVKLLALAGIALVAANAMGPSPVDGRKIVASVTLASVVVIGLRLIMSAVATRVGTTPEDASV